MAAFVVTGGTGALGTAVVRALVTAGHTVAVPYRSAASWAALTAALGEERLWGAPADIADPDVAQRFVRDALARTGSLQGLAAVAGGWAGSGPLHEAPVEEWREMMRTNLDATWAMCRAVLPHLKAGGAIVTVASRAAETGGAGSAAYAASKAGVTALTRVLALENRERGVRVNCVLPGTIDTPANRAAMPAADRRDWTSAEAIADVIVFLLSPGSAPITGALVPVDARG